MDKFLRNYDLSISTNSETPNSNLLHIWPPFTLEFDITRRPFSSANVASLRIYNLSADNRGKIRKDPADKDNFRTVTLKAGYKNNLPIIFAGNITQAWSVREGVNMITQIECFDGGFAFTNSVFSRQYVAGTPQKSIITDMASSLGQYNVTLGKIGDFPGTTSRGNSYSGSTTDLLREITGNAFFIDNGAVSCLNSGEAVEGQLAVINSASGLLGTPVLETKLVRFDMIFEPRLLPAQVIRLESITGANFNGTYKIVEVKHRGMISDAVCGSVITSVTLQAGNFDLVP